METTVTLEYGALNFEIEASESDNYQEKVMELIDFIEENQGRFDEVIPIPDSSEIGPEKSGGEFSQLPAKNESQGSDATDEAAALSTVASQLHVSVSELEQFLHVEPESDQPPVIYTEEIGDLGEKQADEQRVAALILLYLWHVCYDEERIKSTALKDALELSDVSSSGMANMYQGEGDRYFDRRGRGPTATVALTPPGKRQARKEIQRFIKDQ